MITVLPTILYTGIFCYFSTKLVDQCEDKYLVQDEDELRPDLPLYDVLRFEQLYPLYSEEFSLNQTLTLYKDSRACLSPSSQVHIERVLQCCKQYLHGIDTSPSMYARVNSPSSQILLKIDTMYREALGKYVNLCNLAVTQDMTLRSTLKEKSIEDLLSTTSFLPNMSVFRYVMETIRGFASIINLIPCLPEKLKIGHPKFIKNAVNKYIKLQSSSNRVACLIKIDALEKERLISAEILIRERIQTLIIQATSNKSAGITNQGILNEIKIIDRVFSVLFPGKVLSIENKPIARHLLDLY